jgi:arsenate reductase
LAVAEEAGVKFETVLYMKQKPDRDEIANLVAMLEDPPEDLVRKDSKFKALGLDEGDYVGNAEAVIDVLARHPALLQRPVLVKGSRAIIGRPKDRVGPFVRS